MATLKCQRCGFEAANEAKILKHWRAELQCPALYSKVKHQELIEQIRPKPTIEQRTCPHCNKEFKSVGGMKNHSNKCKSKSENHIVKETSQDTSNNQHNNVVIETVAKQTKKTVQSLAELRKRKNAYNTIETYNQLHAFDKEIDWSKVQVDKTTIIELCRKKEEGIIDLFIKLHNNDNYDNIRWFFDEQHEQYKLIVYNGTKWVDISHKAITQHLWDLYSFLEEHWCDYQSSIRCDALSNEELLSDNEQKSIDEFYYDAIVDEESVFFYCKDMFYEYLEAVKTI